MFITNEDGIPTDEGFTLFRSPYLFHEWICEQFFQNVTLLFISND